MSFALDDHNPDNPLPIQNPTDLGYDNWSDFLINLNVKFLADTFNKLPTAIQIDQLRCAIHDLTSILVAMLFQNS